MDQDYDFFLDNIAELYLEFGPKYLAIKEKKVLGAYNSIDEAVQETIKTEKFGTFIIQKCAPSAICATSFFTNNVVI